MGIAPDSGEVLSTIKLGDDHILSLAYYPSGDNLATNHLAQANMLQRVEDLEPLSVIERNHGQ